MIRWTEHIRGRDSLSLRHQLWVCHPAGVVDVSHDASSGAVNGLHHPLQTTGERVAVDAQLRQQLAPIALDIQRLAGQQTRTTLNTADVESDVPICHLTNLRGVTQFDRRHDDPIG